MHDRFVERMEAGLMKLQGSAESGRLKAEAVAMPGALLFLTVRQRIAIRRN